MQQPQWWWMTDDYEDTTPIPTNLIERTGPSGPALVKVFEDGRTTPGWGLINRKTQNPAFIPNYEKRMFHPQRVLPGFERGDWPFAFVMRALPVLCVDIDGKNGGLEHAPAFLGNTPPTLAETSKSGNGFHLFYRVDDSWDPDLGFGRFGDHISIVQGVDIRYVGCVYHYSTQRWNKRPLADLPSWIEEKLVRKETFRADGRAKALAVNGTLDDEERIMAQDALIDELKKPIPQGKRNSTLFALGSQLKLAGIEDWDGLLSERATELGLPAEETAKLVRNIETYAV